jgi:hypothetical protein
MTVKLAFRYLTASSGLANCAAAGIDNAAATEAKIRAVDVFMVVLSGWKSTL